MWMQVFNTVPHLKPYNLRKYNYTIHYYYALYPSTAVFLIGSFTTY